MSIIENALKKLQGSRPVQASPPALGGRPQSDAPSPVADLRRQKVRIEGPKHHVDPAALVRGGLLAPDDQALPIADEFRRIKRPLIKTAFSEGPMAEMHGNVIMITSPLPGAGKTFCSVNLAVSMSLERDVNVLLVDADVAKPHITREFGLGNSRGLIDLLLEDTDVADVLVRTDLYDVQVLPAGKPHPEATELLASERMSRLVHELATRYSDRIILLDSPPLLITSEAQALANQVGQITLIIEAGRTTQQQLSQVMDVLSKEKSINVVLNKSRNGRWLGSGEYTEYGYGHSHGYRYEPDAS